MNKFTIVLVLFCFLVSCGLGGAPKDKNRRGEGDSRYGMVCGDPAILGEALGDVPGEINGCGVKDAVKVRSVSGVTLSQGAVMDCDTANALKKWVNTGVKPAFSELGGGVSGLRVAAHYVCRTRNHKAGAKISEHGKGRAIDISGFTTKDGNEYSVLTDYTRARAGKAIRQSHKAACGPFGTTLGPGSDGYHEDHLHMDTARYPGGPYCK